MNTSNSKSISKDGLHYNIILETLRENINAYNNPLHMIKKTM